MYNKVFLVPSNLYHSGSDPITGSDGDIYFNTTSNRMRVFYSSSWNDISSGNGLPVGGTTGQILTKIDSTNYNTQWVDQTSIATSTVKHLVKNDSGVTLAKGTVVYTSGANGTNILVKRALAGDGEQTSSQTLGFLESELAPNGIGYAITNGIISNINTNGASAGDPVWLSPTTPGGFVTGVVNKPQAPYHLVYLGVITRANANTGEIFVHMSNGWELDELHNVNTASASYNDVLSYSSASNIWINESILNIITRVDGSGSGIDADLLDGQHGSYYAPINTPTFIGTSTFPTLLLTTADTATTSSHYIVENASDGIIRPKTLENVRTEIVTTAAVNSASATTLGTITSGVWQGSSISTAYTDAKVTSVNGSTGAVTGLATTAYVTTATSSFTPIDTFFLGGM